MTTYMTTFYFKDTSQPLHYQQDLWIYFGTFVRSLFTMFELTFANWPPVARLLTENVHGCFAFLTVLYKLTLGFAVVGVVNGVFIQETFKAMTLDDTIMIRQKRKATDAHLRKMLKFFEAADTTKDGELSRDEIQEVFHDAEVREWFSAMDFPECDTPEKVDQ